MGKIVFFNIPAQGHIDPTLPIVSELVRRGEEVLYFVQPEFREKIEFTGAVFRPALSVVGHDPKQRHRSIFHLARTLARQSLAYLPQLLEELRREEIDLIVHDTICPWGRLAAQSLGIPAICSCCMLAVHKDMLRMKTSPLRVREIVRGLPALGRFYALTRQLKRRFGLRKVGLFEMLTNYNEMTLVYTSKDFQFLPDRFGDDFQFVGPSFHEEASDEFPFDVPDRPLIYISRGTHVNDDAAFFRACLQAFGDLENPVIMTLGSKTNISQLGALPPNFHVANYVPQVAVLRRASVFVCHGGHGSVCQSLYFGVPLVVCPTIGEQLQRGQLVEQKGVGKLLDRDQVTPQALRETTLAVLHDAGARERAVAMGESFRQAGGYRRAAQEVLKFRDRRTKLSAPTT